MDDDDEAAFRESLGLKIKTIGPNGTGTYYSYDAAARLLETSTSSRG